MSLTQIEGGVCASKGFQASGVYCGIRKNPNKKDLALIYSDVLCNATGVYTQNKTKAAPLQVTASHLESNKTAQAIICNSGNANACTNNGVEIAESMCDLVGKALSIPAEHVLVASTGVIGVPMTIDPIANHVNDLAEALSTTGNSDCAEAIMTTDLVKKEIAFAFDIGGKTVHIGGVSKGSGMIHPNMATLLGFITTDANIAQDLMVDALSEIVKETFNMISVDGDTSTNDMVLLLANGLAENDEINTNHDNYATFYNALREVCLYLAISIASDGEGASKLLECTVSGAPTLENARILAKSVITSSLFKAAMYGADANWGRVLCALGYADTDFDPSTVDVAFSSEAGTLPVCKGGFAVPFNEDDAKKILSTDKVIIDIQLNSGDLSATAWGCDLTYDYVKINGDYRS